MFLFGHHIGAKLDAILRGIGILLRRTEHMSKVEDDIAAGVAEIETAVTEGTTEIKSLADQIKANTTNPDALEALAGRLHDAATKMHTAVTDVTTPITAPADPGDGGDTGGDPQPEPEPDPAA